MKMKKILMTGACLAALSGPAFADCPYIAQYDSLSAQFLRAVAEANASKKCSPEYFSAGERAASLIRQANAIANKARGHRGCKVMADVGGATAARNANILQEERAECAAIAKKKQEEERAATLNKQDEER